MFRTKLGTLRKSKKSLAADLTELTLTYRAEQANLPNTMVRALYLESNKEFKAAEKLLHDLEGQTVVYSEEDFITVHSAKLAVILKKHSSELPKQFIEQRNHYKSQTLRHTHGH